MKADSKCTVTYEYNKFLCESTYLEMSFLYRDAAGCSGDIYKSCTTSHWFFQGHVQPTLYHDELPELCTMRQ